MKRTFGIAAASRALTVAAVVFLIGVLPWLSGRSPELTILRARSTDQEATPEALAAIREQLHLDQGPFVLFGGWFGGVLRGDLGTSWISGRPVGPGIAAAMGVSLTLMAFAFAVALVVASLLALPSLFRAVAGVGGRGSGVAAAATTATPEFLLASVLLIIGAVWLRWFPPYGWTGLSSAVLPALALGLPAGGLLGRLVSDGIAASAGERWINTWQVAGFSSVRLGAALVRRALPSLMTQIALVLVGLTGGAIAVEQVFAIPGLGRATLGAAQAQDLPALQAGILSLLALAAVVGLLAALARRIMLGPAARLGSLPQTTVTRSSRRWDAAVPVVAAILLLAVIIAGLLRDPYASNFRRLEGPSLALPFGADASGRDLLARVGHGGLVTLGTALGVVLVCLVIGLAVGLLPRVSVGPIEVTNAAPPVIAGLLVTAVAGPTIGGAAIAVTVVSWAPLAAHTAALVAEVRARPYARILPMLGVGPARMLFTSVLPAVVGPVFRHAMLRLPGIALALAALGFLGLGPQPPSPEWGLLLADGMAYAERAPWAVAGPVGALILASVIAVSASSLSIPSGSLTGRFARVLAGKSSG